LELVLEASAADIVYTNLFTGVHGNYLKRYVVRAGLDPDNLPGSDASKMSFGSDKKKPKAWKDIWDWQGIGAVKDVPGAADDVARLVGEYAAAKAARAA
jgi:nitronate monooxygenase